MKTISQWLISVILFVGWIYGCGSWYSYIEDRNHPEEYSPNSNPDKKLELLANVIAFEKKHYSVSDMCLTFRRGDNYEYEYPKSHIKWILMTAFGETNRTDYSDLEAGYYVALGAFQMHFDDGYTCVNFPNAKTPSELSDAMIEYIVELMRTNFDRNKNKK